MEDGEGEEEQEGKNISEKEAWWHIITDRMDDEEEAKTRMKGSCKE